MRVLGGSKYLRPGKREFVRPLGAVGQVSLPSRAQFQPVDPKSLHDSSASLVLDYGKEQYYTHFMSLKEWGCEFAFSE